jgi:hypothetical protein
VPLFGWCGLVACGGAAYFQSVVETRRKVAVDGYEVMFVGATAARDGETNAANMALGNFELIP